MDPLEQDQVDIAARLEADPYFEDVTVLKQRDAVLESDIERALSTLTEKDSKIGVCAIVLMPTLTIDGTNAPGPLYGVSLSVQVIENPTFNLNEGGTGKSAEQIAHRVRQILHHFVNGYGSTFSFAKLEPLPRPDGEISYGVTFSRKSGDTPLPKVEAPRLSATNEAAPATVTLTCDTVGAVVIRYTTDGSPPCAGNAAALVYSAPFVQATAATIRAAASLTDFQQSNTRHLTLS